MLKIFFILVSFCSFVFADVAKVLKITPLEKGVEIKLNQSLKSSDIKQFVLENKGNIRYVYDLKANLTTQAENIDYTNALEARIAQNAKDKVRIVFTSKTKQKITLKNKAKEVEFFISNAQLQKQSVNIASLFEQKNSKTKNGEKKQIKKENVPLIQHQTNIRKKIIVVDPGHGGKDCGAIGVNKLCEKKVVLAVGKYLKDELQDRGYRVYMTRENDKFITLTNRTKFANNKNADLFISIHANAIADNKHKFEGVESYFLSTARSERAKKVAALENKDDTEVMNYFSKQSFLNTINTQRIIASNRLAIDVQYGMLQSLKGDYKIVDGGVREGPFWVLAGAVMPSILLEIGYITHPSEGKRLNQAKFQRTIAKGIANGVDNYFFKNP